MKDELGIKRVRVLFDNPSSQAMSRHTGRDEILEIHLPALTTILSQKPELSQCEGIAKLKSAIAEELCHGQFRETDHNHSVVGCIISEIRKNKRRRALLSLHHRKDIALRASCRCLEGNPNQEELSAASLEICAITSGLRGSPALEASFRLDRSNFERSSRMNILQIVGAAQIESI